jgi:hypothetical protein
MRGFCEKIRGQIALPRINLLRSRLRDLKQSAQKHGPYFQGRSHRSEEFIA